MKNKLFDAMPMYLFFLVLLTSGCHFQKSQKETPVISEKIIEVPDFNPDSAYHYIQRQVDFGPRVPNTPAHIACGNYLVEKLKSYNATVYEQEFREEAFNGTTLNLRNIIASIHPDKTKRILLAAHWDSRPFADKDSIRTNFPIDGANDGGSGVGVLLEIARIVSLIPPSDVGIDIVLFDGEDYGEPETYPYEYQRQPGKIWWCLGSQYWSQNKHIPNYMAYYGILLDMVGAEGATFYKEGGSMQFARKIVEKVWSAASRIGYSPYFIPQPSPGITDDHIFINRYAKIPTINIVEYDPSSPDSYFADYHHTHRDDMEIIDKATLKAVGQTVLYVLYHE